MRLMNAKPIRTPTATAMQRVDDALPELVEVLQKRHLPAGGFIVFLGENTCGGPGL